jgi:hypothetical protein
MEGQEVRFGIANFVLWATTTTVVSNGSDNAMHDASHLLAAWCPCGSCHWAKSSSAVSARVYTACCCWPL